MSEAEFRQAVWDSCIKRVAARVDEFSDGWLLNGPSKAAADAIRNEILRMPVPVPAANAGEQK
jgi:hypothetical protein